MKGHMKSVTRGLQRDLDVQSCILLRVGTESKRTTCSILPKPESYIVYVAWYTGE